MKHRRILIGAMAVVATILATAPGANATTLLGCDVTILNVQCPF